MVRRTTPWPNRAEHRAVQRAAFWPTSQQRSSCIMTPCAQFPAAWRCAIARVRLVCGFQPSPGLRHVKCSFQGNRVGGFTDDAKHIIWRITERAHDATPSPLGFAFAFLRPSLFALAPALALELDFTVAVALTLSVGFVCFFSAICMTLDLVLRFVLNFGFGSFFGIFVCCLLFACCLSFLVCWLFVFKYLSPALIVKFAGRDFFFRHSP